MSSEVKGNKILLLGFGREGKSTLRYLQHHYPHATFGIADKQCLAPVDGVTLHTGDNYLESLQQYDTIVRTPGIKIAEDILHDLSSRGILVTSATRIFFECCPGVTIGITGTKGKSTSCALIAHLLKSSYADVRLAGNIGTPMIDALEGATSETIFVLELSSYQLDDLSRGPHIAVLLNIVPEHLNYHGSFSSYVAAKANIARFQKDSDLVIYNPRFELPAATAKLSPARKIQFDDIRSDATFFHDNGTIFFNSNGYREALLQYSSLKIKGDGNLQNLLAALCVAHTLKVPLDRIRGLAKTFSPLEHRLEEVGTFKGITFVNDSLSTVPEALINALNAYQGQVETVIAGGFDRGLDFAALREPFQQSQVQHLILFPTTGEAIWKAVTLNQPGKLTRHDVDSMEQAVALGYSLTSEGKVCLMSPASPSFSLFKDYQHRGDCFKQLVHALGKSS